MPREPLTTLHARSSLGLSLRILSKLVHLIFLEDSACPLAWAKVLSESFQQKLCILANLLDHLWRLYLDRQCRFSWRKWRRRWIGRRGPHRWGRVKSRPVRGMGGYWCKPASAPFSRLRIGIELRKSKSRFSSTTARPRGRSETIRLRPNCTLSILSLN